MLKRDCVVDFSESREELGRIARAKVREQISRRHICEFSG